MKRFFLFVSFFTQSGPNKLETRQEGIVNSFRKLIRHRAEGTRDACSERSERCFLHDFFNIYHQWILHRYFVIRFFIMYFLFHHFLSISFPLQFALIFAPRSCLNIMLSSTYQDASLLAYSIGTHLPVRRPPPTHTHTCTLVICEGACGGGVGALVGGSL